MERLAITRRVAELATAQHGNVDLDRLRAAGLTDGAIRQRVDDGWLVPRHARVYAVGHVPRSRPSRWHAAVLALGPEAVLSYESAAALFEVVRGATKIDCTTLIRVMLDLAAVRRGRSLARVFEQAQVEHNLDPNVLAAELIARPRHRGSGRLKLLLEDAVDPTGVRSVLELRFLRLCAQHGIPRPLVNQKLGPYVPDFLWPEHSLVVETDGVRFHRTAAQRRRDAEKDVWLETAGYRVIRLRWADVTANATATAARIMQAYAGAPTPTVYTAPSSATVTGPL